MRDFEGPLLLPNHTWDTVAQSSRFDIEVLKDAQTQLGRGGGGGIDQKRKEDLMDTTTVW